MPDTPPLLNLSTLPADIMRLVASMEEESLAEIRMISPSWNASVQAHLADNRYKQPLERVFIRVPDDSSEEEDNDEEDEEADRISVAKVDPIVMHAILPTTCCTVARIGVGKWLTVHEQFTDATEVTCTPQIITPSSIKVDDEFGAESDEVSENGSDLGSESAPFTVPRSPRSQLPMKRRGGCIDSDHAETKKAKKDASYSSSTYSLRSNKDPFRSQLSSCSGQTLLAQRPVTFKQQSCPKEKQSISRRSVEEEWRTIEKANREIEEQRRINEENARKNEMDRRKIEEDLSKIEEEWKKIDEWKTAMDGRIQIVKESKEDNEATNSVKYLPRRSTAFNRFARFFANFSHIETVVLEDFFDPDLATATMAMMGDLRVNRLDIRFFFSDDDDMRTFMLDSVRKHRIRHVLINMYSDGVKKFVSFVSAIVKLQATIDFYDHGCDSNGPVPKTKYFGRLPAFWAEKCTELGKEGISMIFSTSRDSDFDEKLSEKDIRAHISVMSVEQRKSGLNVDIEEVRGIKKL